MFECALSLTPTSALEYKSDGSQEIKRKDFLTNGTTALTNWMHSSVLSLHQASSGKKALDSSKVYVPKIISTFIQIQ
jgi:hypothetical protein